MAWTCPSRPCRSVAAMVEITAFPHSGCAKFVTRFGGNAMRFVNAELVGQVVHGDPRPVVVAIVFSDLGCDHGVLNEILHDLIARFPHVAGCFRLHFLGLAGEGVT